MLSLGVWSERNTCVVVFTTCRSQSFKELGHWSSQVKPIHPTFTAIFRQLSPFREDDDRGTFEMIDRKKEGKKERKETDTWKSVLSKDDIHMFAKASLQRYI
jgi:hypothetical protein